MGRRESTIHQIDQTLITCEREERISRGREGQRAKHGVGEGKGDESKENVSADGVIGLLGIVLQSPPLLEFAGPGGTPVFSIRRRRS